MATIDIHCHPGLKTWLFNSNFETDHPTLSKDFLPTDMVVDYPKMVKGEVDVILSSVYLPESSLIKEVDPSTFVKDLLNLLFNVDKKAESNSSPNQPFEQTLEFINHFEKKIEQAQGRNCNVCIARNFTEMENLLEEKKKVILHSIEGAHSLGRAIDGKTPDYIENINKLFNRGVCLLTLAHFYANDIAAPVIGMPPSVIKKLKLSGERDLSLGLTPSGEEVVKHILDIGMIIDLTHCTRKARDKVFEINNNRGDKKRPLVFTHVGFAGICDHPMNPDEEEINKIKDCNGTVGIIFYNYYLMGKEEDDPLSPIIDFNPEPGIEYIFNTIDKIHDITGTYDNISIGSDLDGFTDPPDDLYNLARFKFLKEKLIEKYGSDAAEKILGNNMLRVLRSGWGNNN